MKYINIIRLLSIATLMTMAPGVAFATKSIETDERQQARLIYTSLLTLNNANLTGNYTVLLDSAAPNFRAVNTSYRLTQVFSKFRTNKLDMGAIVLQNPKLTQDVRIDKNGVLHLEGYFATRPLYINFKLSFQNIAGAWRLYGIGVKPILEKAMITSSLGQKTAQ